MGRNQLITTAALAILTMLLTATIGHSEEDNRLSWGADMRIRLTHLSSEVTDPNSTGANISDTEKIRWRSRFWIGYQANDNVRWDVRLVNQWRHYSTAPWNPNNQSKTTWRFPDEIVFDKLSLTMTDLFDIEGLSVVLGRQDIIIGNGMIVLEGTWRDAGRTIYQDGALLTYKTDSDIIKAFATYNTREDEFIVINDRDRQLRHEDTWLYGIDWTHLFDPAFNTELMVLRHHTRKDIDVGIYSHVDLMVYSGRVFGKPHDLFDYSGEYAYQRGDRAKPQLDASAHMADLRLGLNAPADTWSNPRLEFQYTYMSGDDASTPNKVEGWHPIFAEYPIWREEYFPNQFGAVWTNWEQYRTALSFRPLKGLTVTGAYHYITRPEKTGRTGTGYKVGDLYCLFVDYQVMKNPDAILKSWVAKLEVAHLRQGDWYADDSGSGEWVRLENTFTF